MDGQSERSIQTLKDMLRACIIDFGGTWDLHLPLVESSYNIIYHASIQMLPYEMLYGRNCLSPICCVEVGQPEIAIMDVVKKTVEKLEVVRDRLKASQDRQKSYAHKRRRPVEFNVGDRVLLKVSPWNGVLRFRKRGKLSPHFVGPFKILEGVGKVVYLLELPEELSGIHSTFHISHLRKCLIDDALYVPLREIEVESRLNYVQLRRVQNIIQDFVETWKHVGLQLGIRE